MESIPDKLTFMSRIMSGHDDVMVCNLLNPDKPTVEVLKIGCAYALKRVDGCGWEKYNFIAVQNTINARPAIFDSVHELISVMRVGLYHSIRSKELFGHDYNDVELMQHCDRLALDRACSECLQPLRVHIGRSRRYYTMNPSLVGTPAEEEFMKNFNRV